jgi:hypothetical protein
MRSQFDWVPVMRFVCRAEKLREIRMDKILYLSNEEAAKDWIFFCMALDNLIIKYFGRVAILQEG